MPIPPSAAQRHVRACMLGVCCRAKGRQARVHGRWLRTSSGHRSVRANCHVGNPAVQAALLIYRQLTPWLCKAPMAPMKHAAVQSHPLLHSRCSARGHIHHQDAARHRQMSLIWAEAMPANRHYSHVSRGLHRGLACPRTHACTRMWTEDRPPSFLTADVPRMLSNGGSIGGRPAGLRSTRASPGTLRSGIATAST